MVYRFTTKFYKEIANEAKADCRPRANLIKKIVFDNLYTFNDSELRSGKPKTRHGVKMESIALTDDEYNKLEKIAKHYNMSVTKLVAFVLNQYYENKEN